MDEASNQSNSSQADSPKAFTDHAKEAAANLLSKASEDPSQLLQQAKEEGSRLLGTAGERVKDMAGEGKSGAADKLKDVAGFVRDAARQMDEKNLGSLSGYVHNAAERIETVSDSIRDQDIGELISQAQDFGRRNPTIFFAGAVVAGLLLSRFLKASSSGYSSYGGSSGGRQVASRGQEQGQYGGRNQ